MLGSIKYRSYLDTGTPHRSKQHTRTMAALPLIISGNFGLRICDAFLVDLLGFASWDIEGSKASGSS